MTFKFWNWRKKKVRTVVLGKELAEATEREKQRIESSEHLPSPLPDFDYRKWPDEQSLINPVKNELDFKIVALIEEFENVDEFRKDELRKSISQDDIYTLLEFIRRAILFGVRNNDATDVHNGFIALAMIEAERCDYRDVLVALSFLYFAIHQLNLNELPLLEKVNLYSYGRTKQLLKEFMNRPVGARTTEALGSYTAIQTDYGIGFVRTNTTRYNAEKNLIKILFDFENILSKDKYARGEITLERNIASVWIGAEGDKKIEKFLSSMKGCASLKTNLKKEYHPKAELQSLYIYLAEYNDNESAEILTSKANTTPTGEFARLTFSEGKIFCLVIQRAIMHGLEHVESNASLSRFEKPFLDLIKQG